jgi:glutamyl-tRNA synthetase
MEEEKKKVVTRFAPSPTGFVHVGNIRSALYPYLWARKHGGRFILRIEDTDKNREVEGSINHIMESLKWLDIAWDEGPDIGGEYAPYLQSDRLSVYNTYAKRLIDKGLAYPDPYTEEEVEALRQKAEQEKRPFLYREYRPETFDAWDGTKPLRFKIPEVKSYSWHDVVFGDLSAGPEALDDFILIKSDGYPTYNFAHIVDDLEMNVSHIMRGQEYISSMPKYLALYEALEITPPVFVSLPHIMAPDGKKKLGKRDGAKDVLEYRNEGYLPSAIVNFLALLGWHGPTDKEVFTREELIREFDITRINNSGAQMNLEKLEWMNKEHMKRLAYEEVEKHILEWLPEGMKNPKLVPIIFDRISKWSDVKTMAEKGELDLFFKAPIYEKEKLVFKQVPMENIKAHLQSAYDALEQISQKDFNVENIKHSLMSIADTLESRGELLHPVRFALSGLDKSPDPFLIASIIGKDETLSRLQKAIS